MLAVYFTGKHDYDLLVIGGGSGGLACSKEGTKTALKGMLLMVHLSAFVDLLPLTRGPNLVRRGM